MKRSGLTVLFGGTLVLMASGSCTVSRTEKSAATRPIEDVATASEPTNLALNPNFEFVTNGDGTGGGNTQVGLSSPLGSYTIGTGPTAAFHGVGSGPGQYPENGTAMVPGWFSVGIAGAEHLEPSTFYTAPKGATGYGNGGNSFLFQVVPDVLRPRTMYKLSVRVYARRDVSPEADVPQYSSCLVQLRDGERTYLAGTRNSEGADVGVSTSAWANGCGTVTVTYTTPAKLKEGSRWLMIMLGGDYQMNYQNVVLQAVPAK